MSNGEKRAYQDLPVAGSISPVKITLRLCFVRFSSRILGKDSTSRITVNWYLGMKQDGAVLLLGHLNRIEK